MNTFRNLLCHSVRQPTLLKPHSLKPHRTFTQISKRFLTTEATSAAEHVPPPTWKQLRTKALISAVPMVGFGFMDNIVMINVGDFIDTSIGVTFALSTITAAGLGQCVSDVCGVCFGGTVEALANKLGLPVSSMTPQQMGLRSARIATTGGAAIGVLCGCMLVMLEGHALVGAERCTLFLLDMEKGELWSQYATNTGLIKVPISSSIAGETVLTRQIVNLADAYDHPKFCGTVDKATGFRTRAMLSAPVIGDDGEVIGVVQMINKKGPDGQVQGFSDDDVKLVRMLCSHVALFVKQCGGVITD